MDNHSEIRKAVEEGKDVWRVSPNRGIELPVVEEHGEYFIQRPQSKAPIEDYDPSEFVIKGHSPRRLYVTVERVEFILNNMREEADEKLNDGKSALWHRGVIECIDRLSEELLGG